MSGQSTEATERTFIHDLASPLSTAIFLLDMVVEDLQSRQGGVPEELTGVVKAYSALERIRTLLSERCAFLIGQGKVS